ncbi:MAG: hypothetical protein K0S12_84 [Bacteroidetes bacterium]|jgi:hypothetical protein|nr:hypothetical protein [Bacteroidota bacterium]
MEEYNYNDTPGPNRAARIINIVNGAGLALMLLLCLIPDAGGFFSFLLGCVLGLGNFICMIIQITHKNVAAYVSNIIWMLLMPIVGFGCCAATFSLHG